MKRTQMRAMSDKLRAQRAAEGDLNPTSTFRKTPKMATGGRQAYTGPKKSVTERVDERSGGMCEWPCCPERQTERHHRKNRKAGGRHGEAKELLNGVAWLLAACRVHHAYVTSPFGERRALAISMGWLLLEHEDATQVPVWTRHSDEPVFLTPEGGEGGWVRYEEAGT